MAVANSTGGIEIDLILSESYPTTVTRKVPVSGPDGQTTYKEEAITVMKTVYKVVKRTIPPEVRIYRSGREISAEERSAMRQPTPIFIAKLGSSNEAPGKGFEGILGDALVAFIPSTSSPTPFPGATPLPSGAPIQPVPGPRAGVMPSTQPKTTSTSPPASAKQEMGNATSVEKEIIEKTNAARKEAGLTPLKFDATLANAARLHSEYIAKIGKIEHVVDGKGPHERLVELGMKPFATGENCAQGQQTASDAMDTWMTSPDHKGNILNPQYTLIGVGKADSPTGPYWTQVFARTEP